MKKATMPARYQAQIAAALARGKPVGMAHAKELRTKAAMVDASPFFVRMGLPAPVAEYRFHQERRWRFDYAWPEHMVALEVEGGVWTGGRHTRGAGFVRDMEKYNAAALAGWAVLRVVPKQLQTAETVKEVRAAMGRESNAKISNDPLTK